MAPLLAGAGYEPLLGVVAFGGMMLLGVWALRAANWAERLGAALPIAGAAGNLLDRLVRPPAVLHGGVVDWLHVSPDGPTFNLADGRRARRVRFRGCGVPTSWSFPWPG